MSKIDTNKVDEIEEYITYTYGINIFYRIRLLSLLRKDLRESLFELPRVKKFFQEMKGKNNKKHFRIMTDKCEENLNMMLSEK